METNKDNKSTNKGKKYRKYAKEGEVRAKGYSVNDASAERKTELEKHLQFLTTVGEYEDHIRGEIIEGCGLTLANIRRTMGLKDSRAFYNFTSKSSNGKVPSEFISALMNAFPLLRERKTIKEIFAERDAYKRTIEQLKVALKDKNESIADQFSISTRKDKKIFALEAELSKLKLEHKNMKKQMQVQIDLAEAKSR